MPTRIAVCLAAALACAACGAKTDIGNLNGPVYEDFTGGHYTRSQVQNLVSGVLDLQRYGVNATYGYVIYTGSLAHDLVRIDPSEPRYFDEIYATTPDPSGFIGGGAWANFYRDVRAVNTLVGGLKTTAASEVSDAEKAGVRGLVQTLKALDYYYVIETRDSLGVPIAVERAVDAAPASIVCKPQALAYVSALLDSAYADLQAGGAAFPVALPSGYAAFNTPAGFAKVNRALKAKVELYRALSHQSPDPNGFRNALTALSQSFLDVTRPLATGVYYSFSTASGDQTNVLSNDANLHANPSFVDSAETGDKRLAKVTAASKPYSRGLITTRWNLAVYPSLTSPLPLITNEELILLHAQANIGLGDLSAALADLNIIRVTAGGLAPRGAFASPGDALNELLKQKRYSLFAQGAQRLVDLRAYGRLRPGYVPAGSATDPFNQGLPIPQNEVDARGGDVSCKTTIDWPAAK